jgi:hypothetical protein
MMRYERPTIDERQTVAPQLIGIMSQASPSWRPKPADDATTTTDGPA